MNHMIHNLTPDDDEVFITYELDFIPDTAPAAAGMKEVRTLWLDTVGGWWPVFDVKRGDGGRDGRFTFPDEARGAPRNGWTAPEDGVLVGGSGHLHPGRPVDGSRAHPRGAHGAPLPLRREVPRARRGGVLGRVDDGDAARLEGPAAPR